MLRLRNRLNDRSSVAGGYRAAEDGANVDAVYNLAWLHYTVLSTRMRFQVAAMHRPQQEAILKAGL